MASGIGNGSKGMGHGAECGERGSSVLILWDRRPETVLEAATVT